MAPVEVRPRVGFGIMAGVGPPHDSWKHEISTPLKQPLQPVCKPPPSVFLLHCRRGPPPH